MVRNFLFQTTRSILAELGASSKLGGLLQGLGCARGGTIMVVSDPGCVSAGCHTEGVRSVAASGFEPVMFTDVVPDPPESVVLAAVTEARERRCVGVVGLGGGSSMDVAKLVAFLADPACTQDLSSIYGVGACEGGRLPLVQVPTTAGTGSEVTPIR